MVAIALLHGRLGSEDYHDNRAADPRIDRLRGCMEVIENPDFTRAYHDPSRRAIPGAVQIFFNDSSHSERIVVEYPVGHRQRREEALPLLQKKFRKNTGNYLDKDRCEQVLSLLDDSERFDAIQVSDFMLLLGRQH